MKKLTFQDLKPSHVLTVGIGQISPAKVGGTPNPGLDQAESRAGRAVQALGYGQSHCRKKSMEIKAKRP